MIRYIDGNLLDDSHEFDVIGHVVNCFCTMGAGIAPQIKSKFPEAYEVDCATIKGDRNKLGTITHTVNTIPIVVNLYGIYDYKKLHPDEVTVKYDALRLSIRAMKEKFYGKTFGLPLLGAGLANGNWSIIEKIIEEEMMGEYVTIVRYIP